MNEDYERLRRYFLSDEPGEPDEDRERIEQRLLADDPFFELAEMVEDDLLDAAARGELAGADLESLERRFAASPGGRVRLALARELAARADGLSETVPGFAPPLPFRTRPPAAVLAFRAASVAAGLAALLGGAWLAMRSGQAPSRMAHREAAPAVARPAAPIAPTAPPSLPMAKAPETPAPGRGSADHLASQNPAPSPKQVVSTAVLELSLLTTRGDETLAVLSLPAGTERVELRLALGEGEPYRSYRALVRSAAGKTVWDRDRWKPRAGAGLVLKLPAAVLAAGRYELALTGVTPDGRSEDVGFQEFEVVTKRSK
ncbi:MAG TPA: hypothetical protein VOA87_02750 [Thermoanaerobaculia bacterium]|nr:hypothetical protein [Thermoanaerobaculia bacterium]